MSKSSSLILILLAIGLFYTFTSPQYEDAQALASQSAEYQNVIDNVERIAEARDQLLLSYESISAEDRTRLNRILPSNLDAVGFAKDLDALASRYGVSVQSVQIETSLEQNGSNIELAENSKPYGRSFVTFTFVSNYPNFLRLLGDLERSLRLMDIQNISFEVGETGNLYEHTVTAETYWLK